MTDADRIKRLENAFGRLCDVLKHMERSTIGYGTELELLKQYVRGDLEPRPYKPDAAEYAKNSWPTDQWPELFNKPQDK